MTTLNFKCIKCNKEFDFNVGKIFDFANKRFRMQNEPTCPICRDTTESNLVLTDRSILIIQEFLNKKAIKKVIKAYKPGELINYATIFGGGEMFSLSFKDSEYKIADYYCIAPLCNCKEVVLYAFHTGLSLDDSTWRFVYNYDLDKIIECDNIFEQEAREIIKKLKESDKDIFLKRHIALKKELGSLIYNKFFKNKKSPRKIGRNELCPCGSGKKYKKCCLDKKEK